MFLFIFLLTTESDFSIFLFRNSACETSCNLIASYFYRLDLSVFYFKHDIFIFDLTGRMQYVIDYTTAHCIFGQALYIKCSNVILTTIRIE